MLGPPELNTTHRANARIRANGNFKPGSSCRSLLSLVLVVAFMAAPAPQVKLTSAQTRHSGANINDWFKQLHSSEEIKAQSKKADGAFLVSTTQRYQVASVLKGHSHGVVVYQVVGADHPLLQCRLPDLTT